MRKEFVEESIEHYQELIKYYDKTIAETEREWMSPNIGDKKRHAYKMLIEVMETKKRDCQKAIDRLLDE